MLLVCLKIHSYYSLNMDLRQRRKSYDYKLSFGPLAGIMVVMEMMIIVRARKHNYNYCRAKL